ncbi:MAG: hypothetical protein WAK60_09735 [Sedimentisphaerales bacterium]
MLIIIVFFAAVFGASALLGESARNNCFWAIVINGIAACGGIAPFIYAGLFKPSIPVYYLLAAGVIRLLLAVTGCGVILYFVKIDTLWFAVWVGMLYLAVLMLEVRFFIKMLAGCDEVDKV